MRDRYWKMKNGKFVKVSDMETSHIENTIKMLETRTIPNLEHELKIAEMMGETGMVEQQIHYAKGWIKYFKQVLKERKKND